MNTLTDTQKAYIAGIIDGEGCIGINILNGRSGGLKRLQLRVLVANTNLALINWLCETTGIGYIFRKVRRNNPKAKDGYEWIVTSIKALELLSQIKEYLVIKKVQADIAIEFQNTVDPSRHGIFVPQEIIERRYELKKLMNDLNRKGVCTIEEGGELGETLTGNADGNPEPSGDSNISGVRRD